MDSEQIETQRLDVDEIADNDQGEGFESFEKLGKQFLQKAVIVVDDISPRETSIPELLTVIDTVYVNIVRLGNSVRGPSKDQSRLLTELAEAVSKKITQVATFMTGDENKSKLEATILSLQGQVAEVIGLALTIAKDKQFVYHSAHIIISLTLRIFKTGQNKVYRRELNEALAVIADFLYSPKNTQVLAADAAALAAFIKAQNQDLSLEAIKGMQSKYFKHYLLSHVKDPTAQAYLIEKSEDLVFNYKNKRADADLHYLLKFYQGLDEKNFASAIAGQCQFRAARGAEALPMIQKVIESLSFEMHTDTAKLLINDLMSKDYLLSSVPIVVAYISAIAKNVKLSEASQFVKTSLMGYVLQYYKDSKTEIKFTFEQRLGVFRILFESLKVLTLRQAQIDGEIQSIADSFIEFLLSNKEDCDIMVPDIFIDFFNSDCVTKPWFESIFNQAQIVKINLACQASFFGRLQPINEELKLSMTSQISKKVNTLSFTSFANSTQLLGLLSALIRTGGIDMVTKNEQMLKSILNPASFINTEAFLSDKTQKFDINNHCFILQSLLVSGHLKSSTQVIFCYQRLYEYLFNDKYRFRSKEFFCAIDKISSDWTSQSANFKLFMQGLLRKQVQMFETQKQLVKDEQGLVIFWRSLKREQSRLRLTLRLVLKNVSQNKSKMDQETLILVLKTALHPFACQDRESLRKMTNLIESVLGKENYYNLFQEHHLAIVELFVRQRTGFLSPDIEVRQLASNVLVALAWAGHLDKFITHVSPVFSYSSLERLETLEALLIQEFDKISHYDLVYFSEITKGLNGTFEDRNKGCRESLLELQAAQSTQASQEEAKEEAKVVEATTTDFAALMAKKKQAAAAGSQAGAKGKKAPPPKTQQPQKTTQAQPAKPHVPEETKEERNKKDRQQMIEHCKQMKALKADQVSSCQNILRLSNCCAMAPRLSYQELIFNHTIATHLRLLNLASTRFSTQYFLHNLLNESADSPFFAIKQSVMTCLIAISQNKLSARTTQEFQYSLHYLKENADFRDMQGGHLQLILTIANFVLKDPSVNLSVKEIALMVTQDILENNSNVQTIDLVRLTINMLKTNYIASNLGQFIHKIMQRTSRIEIALMLQRLHEYQAVPRKTLLNEILLFDEPLFSPVWLQASLWILLFDEDLCSIARKIWNKYGFTITSDAVKIKNEVKDRNLFHYLRSDNIGIFNTTVNAIASAIEHFQFSHMSSILDDLITFYHDEWKVIDQLTVAATDEDSSKDLKVTRNLLADERTNRIAGCKIISKVAHLIQPAHFEKILSHLINDVSHDSNSEIQQHAYQSAVALINAQGERHGKVLLQTFEGFIEAKTGPNASEISKNQSIKLLGTLGPFLQEVSQKKLVATFEQLLALIQHPSEQIKKSVCLCIPQLCKYFAPASKQYLAQQVKIINESNDEKVLKGAAYVTAGIYKSLGMKAVLDTDILGQINKEVFSSRRSEPARKQAALNLYEAFSFSMRKSFEVFLPQVFPNILNCISDQKENVRQAAQSALQQIMLQFSNYAIKQALPTFLRNLEQQENWRSKLSTVEALGSMAYCAPRQISGFLPQIVKGLRDVMNDTHEKVHQAAIDAIQKIGSVIKCPEVGDMLEIIIKALSNSKAHLHEALHLLLETSFVHAIDAPSLSLLVPMLDNGLMMHDNACKHMAAQLMGNICSLVKEPSDLLPYIPILMPAIKNSLYDSIPEIRASAAKALGSLSKGLGITNSMEMLTWLKTHLSTEGIPAAERLGAAQGFSELISVHGERFFEVNIQEVIANIKHPRGEIRESFRTVIVFLPNSYDKFVEKLPSLIPLMIEGLADDKDECRKASMRSIKICIKQFAKVAPDQLVQPVLRMMFEDNPGVRMSSSILMYQLVKELENDIIKAQPKYVSIETKHKILATMFIMKYDPDEKVKLQAGTIWKNIVDNQLLILKQVLETLIRLVFFLVTHSSSDLQEMGLSCMRGMVEKFGEKIINQSIDIFEQLVQKARNSEQTTGVIRVMFNMAQAATYRILTNISPRIIQIIDQNLASDQEDVQQCSTAVLITLFQRQPDKTFIDPILEKSFMLRLKSLVLEGQETEADRLIKTLQDIIIKAPELRIEDRMLILCDILNREWPFTIAQAKVLRALAPTIAHKVFSKRFYRTVLESLEAELTAQIIDDRDRLGYVLMAYAELLTCIPEHESEMTNEQISKFAETCIQLQRPDFYLRLIAHFCHNTASSYEEKAAEYLETALNYINYPQKDLIRHVINCMNAIFEKLPKEQQFALVPLIKRQIERAGVDFVGSGSKALGFPLEHMYRKKYEALEILKDEEGVKSLVSVVQAAIMHGSVEVRIDSAFCFKYILEFAPAAVIKKEIIKICGALIRVVNDKFPQELKLQIFYALKLIQTKGAASAKAMQTQLQTTFLKAFGDNQNTLQVRKSIMENLLILVKDVPRVDPIVKELTSLLEGSKIEPEQKEEVSEALAFIIRTKGKAIQSATSQQTYATLSQVLQNPGSKNVNDKVVVNCATAIAFLSAISSDPAQMKALNSAFDDDGNDCVTLSVKFGILTNGNDNIDKSTMLEELCSTIAEVLKERAGFEEIDDDPAPLIDEESENFKFGSVLETLGYLLDKMARRSQYLTQDCNVLRAILGAVNKSSIFTKLSQEKEISVESYLLLTQFLMSIPVSCPGKEPKLTDELADLLRQGLKCVQQFYLDHDDHNSATMDALLNILQLNYDNYTALDLGINQLTKLKLKEACDNACLQGVISEDMKLYAADIIFKKK